MNGENLKDYLEDLTPINWTNVAVLTGEFLMFFLVGFVGGYVLFS